MDIKCILKKNNITSCEAEEMCNIVVDLLRAYAEETKRIEPTAFNTIRNAEKAAETVNELSYHIVVEGDEEDPADEDDDSNLGCKDCPDELCTGHCMSCYYRS